MLQEKLYQVALGMIPGIGNILTRQLISYCGSAESIFKAPRGKLLKIPQVGEKVAQAILGATVLQRAEREIERAEKLGVQLLFYTDKAYPDRLKHLHDAPALLYFKGTADLNHPKTVAIVGTRQATDYGRQVTEELIEALGKYHPCIVSGLAYGIDICAHKAALRHRLPTLGVMATGMDTIYPLSHQRTAQQMLDNGGLLTEYRFFTKPDAPHFPERNRIIAGMADLVIVVEAANKGGALITAEIANSYNREVFAVPGNLSSKFSEGCNQLIKQHKASMITSISDIEYMMNWQYEQEQKPVVEMVEMQEDEQALFALLSRHEEMLIDDIAWQSQFSVSKVATVLLSLEFKGVVRSLPGKKYRLACAKTV